MSKLRILCATKRVLDYALKPRINKSNTAIDLSGQKQSMNPFCEIGVEEAIRIREKHKDRVEDVMAVSAGPMKAQDTLRTAMAMGADRGILVEVAEGDTLEPLTVAKILKAVAEKEKSNIILLGKQSIDDDCNQTGQMLAGLLGWSQATCASEVKIDGEKVTVTREVDGGTETLETELPIVITTDLRLNEPRFASLPNIMKAKKKPLEKKKLADFGLEISQRFKTLKVVEPPVRQGGDKVEDVDAMVAKLKELKVL